MLFQNFFQENSYDNPLMPVLIAYLCYRLSFDLFYQLFLYLKCLVPATHK